MAKLSDPVLNDLELYISLCVDAFKHSERKFEKDLVLKGNVILEAIKKEKSTSKRAGHREAEVDIQYKINV